MLGANATAEATRLRSFQAKRLRAQLAERGWKLVREGESIRLLPLNPACPPSVPLSAPSRRDLRDLKPELLALLGRGTP